MKFTAVKKNRKKPEINQSQNETRPNCKGKTHINKRQRNKNPSQMETRRAT